MITALLLAAAAALMFGDKLEAWFAAHKDQFAKISRRQLAAAVVVVVALGWLWYGQRPVDDGRPKPAPGAVGELDLTGLFTGPTAADDAVALAGLCDALAQYVQDDGELAKPRLTTGWQVADLRSAARDVRLKGETFGARQPAVRDAVKRYLERPEILGKDGGPLAPKDRAKWISSFRDIARAAEAAVR